MKIVKLDKKHYKNFGGTKYYVDCNDYNPTDILKIINDISIFKEVIKKNKHIVIKIAYNDKANKKEYYILEKLKTINGFIKYFDNTNNILIEPYINLGSIIRYKWTLDKIYILKSLLKQTIISLMEAYNDYGFLHNDLHLDNILFKKTKIENIEYKDVKIKSDGYKVVIMDFDSSFIDVDRKTGLYFYWHDINNIFSRLDNDLKKYLIIINNNIILNILKNNIINLPNSDKTIDLLELIDNLEFTLPSSSILKFKYDPNVFG